MDHVVVQQTFVGIGTAVNVAAVVVGSLLGLAIGGRLDERTRATVTDALGLCTLVIAALSIVPITHAPINQAVGHGAAFVVIILAMLIGGLLGSALRVEDRIGHLGDLARRHLVRDGGDHRFVDAFVTSTLVFCVGPLAILGPISDGLGRGADQLFVKSMLDGFASIAFASALGPGVLVSALAVLVYQGAFTLVGLFLGSILPPAEIDALTIVGGIVLLGLAFRLLEVKRIRVADLLPALALAPVLVWLAGRL